MRRTLAGLLIVLLALSGGDAVAQGVFIVREVPEDFATIQEAINACFPGGNYRVRVAPGTYQECIVIDKDIVVKSHNVESPAIVGKTILKPPAGSNDPVVTFAHPEGAAYLRGFTVTGCSSPYGAIRCLDGRSMKVRHCIIAQNSCAGVKFEPGSSGNVLDCTIRNNAGHGVACWYAFGSISNSRIFNNSDSGIMVTGTSTHGYSFNVVGNLIYGNETQSQGGGIRCMHEAAPVIRNNTIVRNSATFGAGIVALYGAAPTITSCIIAFNEQAAGVQCDTASSATVRYCNVYGHPPGANYSGMTDPTGTDGNVSVDPLFADPNHSDYHLKSAAGRWSPVSHTWVTDDLSSPCIDAGDPAEDVGEEPAPNGGRINMGGYGGREHASKSLVTRRPGGRGPRGGGR